MNALQCRMARAALRENVGQTAQRANVTPECVYKIESGQRIRDADKIALQQAFESLGLIFYENGEGDTGVIIKPYILSIEEPPLVARTTGKKQIYKVSSRTRSLGE